MSRPDALLDALRLAGAVFWGVVHGQNVMSCRNRFIIALSRPNIGDFVTVDPELQVCLAAKCGRPLHNQPTSLRLARQSRLTAYAN